MTSISIIVVPFGGKASLPQCLDSLCGQSGQDAAEVAAEVIVPCDDRVGDTAQLEQRYPGCRFLRLAGTRTYAELRTAGILAAGRGDVVAITEAQCTPAADWVERILEAHERILTAAVIGGVVDKADGSTLSWVMYLNDYNRYMPPVPEGRADYLTDCNVSYKRAILEAIADVWRDEFHETTVHWKLQSLGHTLWLAPSIVVRHGRVLGFAEAVHDRYAFARLFASTRVAATGTTKRIAYALSSILLPAVFTWRAFRSTTTKGRHVGKFVRALPALALITTVWAFGEFCGYVTGKAARSLTPRHPHGAPGSRPATAAAPAKAGVTA